jgi:hypothetical protein
MDPRLKTILTDFAIMAVSWWAAIIGLTAVLGG